MEIIKIMKEKKLKKTKVMKAKKNIELLDKKLEKLNEEKEKRLCKINKINEELSIPTWQIREDEGYLRILKNGEIVVCLKTDTIKILGEFKDETCTTCGHTERNEIIKEYNFEEIKTFFNKQEGIEFNEINDTKSLLKGIGVYILNMYCTEEGEYKFLNLVIECPHRYFKYEENTLLRKKLY